MLYTCVLLYLVAHFIFNISTIKMSRSILYKGTYFDLKIDGIKIFLIDIGIAMVASFLGVFFTKKSTSAFKDARSIMSRNKHKFLSWIQTELMPNLSDDITGALIKMTQDLNEFNSTFASKT